MSTSMDVEDMVIDDVAALLTAAGIANHPAYSKLDSDVDYSAGRVAIAATVAGPSLMGGQFAAGFPRVALELSCETHMGDDEDGSTLRALAKSVREVIEVEELPANLTAQSTRGTYYNCTLGGSFRENDGNMQLLTLTYTLTLRPSQ